MAEDWINVAEVIDALPPATRASNPAHEWLKSLTVGTLYFPPGTLTISWRTAAESDARTADAAVLLPATVNLVFEPGAVLQLRRYQGDDLGRSFYLCHPQRHTRKDIVLNFRIGEGDTPLPMRVRCAVLFWSILFAHKRILDEGTHFLVQIDTLWVTQAKILTPQT